MNILNGKPFKKIRKKKLQTISKKSLKRDSMN